ncbi:MAG TPA: hypothetical protein VJO12_05390 [Stellaceae bacterium]|nr:hypothetical protein [Stellaceae bacterium]
MTSISAQPVARPPLTPASALLLGLALSVAWVGGNLLLPALAPSGVPSTAARLGIYVAVLLGLWQALERTPFAADRRLAVWLAIAIPLTLWLALAWSLAIEGAFRPVPGAGRVPRLPIAIFLPLIVGLPLLLRSRAIAAVLDATPAHWLVALQVYRILGGIFLVNWAHGTVAGIFAWPAGVGDMLTGIMALPVALALAAGSAGAWRAAVLWNIFGITDLAVAVTLGSLSSPGPVQLFGFGIPGAQLGTYPTVLTPAFAVPLSVLFHALSLRQLRRGAVHVTPARVPLS